MKKADLLEYSFVGVIIFEKDLEVKVKVCGLVT
jgi:hypothetical protein